LKIGIVNALRTRFSEWRMKISTSMLSFIFPTKVWWER
jgi:hypothetical protein